MEGAPFQPYSQQQPPQPINTRYKTSMCRHYETNGFCHLAERCHFAHGHQELRTMSDPMPNHFYDSSFKQPQQQPQQPKFAQQPAQPYSNFKTVKCKYFENEGFCRFGTNCSFAHGDVDLRKPTDPVPSGAFMGPTLTGGSMGQQIPGGGGFGPSYPLQSSSSQFQAPPSSLTSQRPNIIINTNEPSITQKLKVANDYINMGDHKAAEQVLHELIYNGHILINYDSNQQSSMPFPGFAEPQMFDSKNYMGYPVGHDYSGGGSGAGGEGRMDSV